MKSRLDSDYAIAWIVTFAIAAVVGVLIGAFFVEYAWNWIMPELGAPAIDYMQAVKLMVLKSILFGQESVSSASKKKDR